MKLQKGSAHVIIIIILIMVLIGALGYIFWQNVSSKDEQVSATKTSESKKDKDNEGSQAVTQKVPDGYVEYADDLVGFSLAYPKEWGTLKDTETQSSSDRLGANGDNIKALADTDGTVRMRIYTEQSFFVQNNAGYVIRYQAGEAMGAEAGTETYNTVSPIVGTTSVYSNVVGETGPASFTQYSLFFKVGTSVVYIDAGNSEEIQAEIAKTVKVQ